MKVLLLNGSPHPKGSTWRALLEVGTELERHGIDTEWFHVGTNPVRGCMGCGMCKKNDLGCCVFGDDPVNAAILKMRECDGLILGSSVHYASATGAATSFFDRLFYSTGGFPGKPGSAVVCCRRGGSTAALEQLNKYFMISNMPLVPSCYWNMVHGNNPDELEKDKEGLLVMRTLARNMAWLLRCIELGRNNGIDHPDYSERVRTNFIRDLSLD